MRVSAMGPDCTDFLLCHFDTKTQYSATFAVHFLPMLSSPLNGHEISGLAIFPKQL